MWASDMCTPRTSVLSHSLPERRRRICAYTHGVTKFHHRNSKRAYMPCVCVCALSTFMHYA